MMKSTKLHSKWIMAYLKMWKAHLHIRKFFILIGLKWKKNWLFHYIILKLQSPFSWRKKVMYLELQKKYSNVIQQCKTRIRKKAKFTDRELSDVYEILGRNLRNINQLNDAYEYLTKAKDLSSHSPALLFELGLIYFIKRNYIHARRSMEAAITKGYDTAPLRIHLGKVYYQMGLFNQAEDCFKRVLHVYPKEGSLYFLLGIVYKSKVEYQMAIDAFKNAIKYGSDQKEEHLGLAEIYTRLGYWEEAIGEYKYILNFDPNNFIAHYFLGWIYEIKGMEDDAIKEYILANKIDPEDLDTQEKLTHLLAPPVQFDEN